MSLLKRLFGKSPAPSAPGASNGQNVLDWRAFAEHFSAACRQHVPGAELEWGEDVRATVVRLKLNNGTEAAIALGDHYAHYRNAPNPQQTLEQLTAAIPATIARMQSEPPMLAEQLYPILRNLDAARNSATPVGAPAPGDELIYIPLVGDIAIGFAFDLPDSMRHLSVSTCLALGIEDNDTLLRVARRNFSNYAGDRTVLKTHTEAEHLYHFELDGVYESSLLLFMTDILPVYEVEMQGDPVFSVPTRSTLMLCGSGDSAALEILRNKTESIHAQYPNPVSRQLYRLNADGVLEVFG